MRSSIFSLRFLKNSRQIHRWIIRNLTAVSIDRSKGFVRSTDFIHNRSPLSFIGCYRNLLLIEKFIGIDGTSRNFSHFLSLALSEISKEINHQRLSDESPVEQPWGWIRPHRWLTPLWDFFLRGNRWQRLRLKEPQRWMDFGLTKRFLDNPRNLSVREKRPRRWQTLKIPG